MILYTENPKESIKNEITRKAVSVHGSEHLILLSWQYSQIDLIDLIQSLLKFQLNFFSFAEMVKPVLKFV